MATHSSSEAVRLPAPGTWGGRLLVGLLGVLGLLIATTVTLGWSQVTELRAEQAAADRTAADVGERLARLEERVREVGDGVAGLRADMRQLVIVVTAQGEASRRRGR